MTGRIKTLCAGFGFITADGGGELFFHHGDIAENSDYAFNDLVEGDRVRFDVVEPQPAKGPRAAKIIWEPMA